MKKEAHTMNKSKPKATKHTKKGPMAFFHGKTKRTVFGVIAAAVTGIFVAGTFVFAATTTPQVYLAPSSGSYTVNDDISVAVREVGNGSAISAAQVGLTYDPAYLKYTSVDGSGSAFGTDLTPGTQNAGKVVMVRFTTGAASATDQLIATVHFTALTAGPANVGFTSLCAANNNPAADCTGLSSAGTSVTISTAGASYTLKAAAAPTCPAGQTGTPPNCVTTPPASPTPPPPPVSTTTKSTSTSITPQGSSSSIIAPNNSEVQLSSPTDIQPATIQPDGVQKVEYYLNNKLVFTAKNVPYTYHIDTKHLLNGSYTLTSITYYTSGRQNKSTQKLLVKNPFSFVQFGLLLRRYIVEILVPFVLIVLAIILAYSRIHRIKWYKGPGSSSVDSSPPSTPTMNVQGPTIVSPSS